jgi:hypothetical protein
LEAGTVHGLTKGSTYDIFPPNTKEFSDASKAIANVEVVSVEADTAKAEIRSGGPVPVGSRAVVRQYSSGDRKLCLHFEGPATSPVLNEIKRAVEGTRPIDPDADDAPKYDQIFRPATEISEAQLVVWEKTDDGGNNTIAVTAADGMPLSSPVSADDPEAADLVLNQLVAWAKWFNLLDLENPDPNQLKIEFTVSADDASDTLDAQPSGGVERTFHNGQVLKLAVKNNSNVRLFFSILDLGSDGSVTVIYPPPGEKQPLEAGKEWSQETEVFLPPDQPRMRDFVKVFATPKPVDFNFLRQEGIKGLPRDIEDPLVTMLGEAALIAKQVAPIRMRANGWTTKTLTFDVVQSR